MSHLRFSLALPKLCSFVKINAISIFLVNFATMSYLCCSLTLEQEKNFHQVAPYTLCSLGCLYLYTQQVNLKIVLCNLAMSIFFEAGCRVQQHIKGTTS
jgi:hypothetical protein